ncbi:MAG TPA: imidazole glycerol phosphate synthase subunit HisH [Vicinamibacterales bacterium]|nr:imidazole glycerol phosphate synthase subunit HisH [Vicinamibacterales bacterium]
MQRPPRIAVVEYGAGNLTSVLKGLTAAGADPFVTGESDDVDAANATVVPGVGNFAATDAISERMRDALVGAVARGRPLLGICLGLQFLFDGSAEAPGVRGLGLLKGRCYLLQGEVKVPHVGWNDLRIVRPSRLLTEVQDGSQVYFTHSYAAPVTDACVAETEYATRFAAAVEQEHVFGVQFHPEKSGTVGLQILRSFVSFICVVSFICFVFQC